MRGNGAGRGLYSSRLIKTVWVDNFIFRFATKFFFFFPEFRRRDFYFLKNKERYVEKNLIRWICKRDIYIGVNKGFSNIIENALN